MCRLGNLSVNRHGLLLPRVSRLPSPISLVYRPAKIHQLHQVFHQFRLPRFHSRFPRTRSPSCPHPSVSQFASKALVVSTPQRSQGLSSRTRFGRFCCSFSPHTTPVCIAREPPPHASATFPPRPARPIPPPRHCLHLRRHSHRCRLEDLNRTRLVAFPLPTPCCSWLHPFRQLKPLSPQRARRQFIPAL